MSELQAPPSLTPSSTPSPRPSPSSGSRTRRVVVRTAWTIALLLVAAIVSHPWWLAPLVARDLADRSGRDVHFDTIRLGLTTSLAPVAVLRGVRIANAPWGDTTVPFASLDEVRFEFAWRRIDGRFVVSKLILRGGQTHLETSLDGRHNWRLRTPDDRGPGHYWFEALEAHTASLTVRNPVTEMEFHGVASDLAPPSDARGTPLPGAPTASSPDATTASPMTGSLTTRIVFGGRFRGVAYQGDMLTGPELTFRDTGRWFPARGSAEVAGARLLLDGRAADLFLAQRIDADATLDGTSLLALRAFASARAAAGAAMAPAAPAAPRAFHVAGRLRLADRQIALDPAKATVGGTDLAGDLALSKTGDRLSIQAHLASDRTDIADLLWIAGRDEARPALPSRLEPPGANDPFAAARRLDLDIVYDAKHLSLAALHVLQSLRVTAHSSDGQLAVSDLDIGWAGGHTQGHAAVDFRQAQTVATIDLDTQGVQIEALQAGKDVARRITGALAGHLALKAAGNDVAALRTSITGQAAFTLRDGTIPSLLDAELGLEAGKLVRTLLSGNEPLPLRCAAAVVTLRDGRADLHDLVIDSANTRTRGSGTFDLRDESVDVVLTPDPKQAGVDLGRSIRLHGRLPRPERSLIDRIAQPAIAACAFAGATRGASTATPSSTR